MKRERLLLGRKFIILKGTKNGLNKWRDMAMERLRARKLLSLPQIILN